MQNAYYKLDDPEVQIQSYAFDVVRSHIPSMGLDEAYADADTIAMHIQDTLHRQMAEYGYEIVKALITNIEPDQRVKDAMNNINASQRNQIAAAAQGDAQKTLAVKKAEGEKETMRLQGEGIAEERKAIAEGLKESLQIIADQGLDIKEAMALVALTQYTDMIRALGEGSQTNTILLPHSPSAVGELMDQIRNGIMVADLTTDTVAAAKQQPQLNGGTAQLSGPERQLAAGVAIRPAVRPPAAAQYADAATDLGACRPPDSARLPGVRPAPRRPAGGRVRVRARGRSWR